MPEIVVSTVSHADSAKWDSFIESSPTSTGYHEWAWRAVFERAFGHRCLYLAAHRDGAMTGALPLVGVRSLLFGRMMTSLPFVNYGGVIADDDSTAQALVAEASRLAQASGCRHVELRHTNRRFGDLPFRQHKVAMRLSIAPGSWERLDRKVRNQVRKAQKSGLRIVRGSVDLLPEFYQVFARNMRDLGTPVYARRFFEEVLQAFPNRTRIIVVRLDRLPVAAGLTFRSGRLVEVPWASSLRSYNSLCPNHLLYWHAIEQAIEDGCETFDFGRSTPGEGTFKFKEQWGAQPVALHWEYWLAPQEGLPDQSPKDPRFRLAIEGWKRLPLWLANAAGPRIVRGIP